MIEDSERQEENIEDKGKHQSYSRYYIDRQNTSSELTPPDWIFVKNLTETQKNSEKILCQIYQIIENSDCNKRKYSIKSGDDSRTISSGFKCKCKKTKCLKMYCECFAVGKMCDGCSCQDCNNNLNFQEQRAIAIDEALYRDPDLFRIPSQRQKRQGCICKKTQCTKKYCQCYSSGLPCGPQCKCINCNNV